MLRHLRRSPSRTHSPRRGQPGPRASRARPLALEVLEDRRLLAASFVPNQVLLQFKDGVGDEVRSLVRQEVGALGHDFLGGLASAGRHEGTELVTLAPGRSVEDVIQSLRNNPTVAFAEPNWVLTKQVTSNDPYFTNGSLWGMYGDGTSPANQFGSQAGEAWAAGNVGSSTVYVGVIDEGIDYTHPDLKANIWTNPYDPVDGKDNDGNGYADDVRGWDFYQNNNSIWDPKSSSDVTTDSHGTHVAGTIGGKGGNAAGVAGVNWNVTIISGKFLGPNGGSIANAVKAINYMADLKERHGLNIVALNNSWGGGGYSQAMQDAITRAAKDNILFIAAAGNGGSDQVGDNNDAAAFYPSGYDTTASAGYDNVIAVAAINSAGGLASFSNYGATSVDLGAPGVGVWSTTPRGGYKSFSGTSMATPHVTGAAALYAAANPGATALDIKNAILGAAIPTASLAGRTVTGGRLNVSNFVTHANDLAVTGVEPLSSSVNQGTVPGSPGSSVNVDVTVKNTGTQPAASGVYVELWTDNGTADTSDDIRIGSLLVGDLVAGASITRTFTWDTAATDESPGYHTLTARLATADPSSVYSDQSPANDAGKATLTVIDPNAPKTPLYFTVPDGGDITLGGMVFQNEDIVWYDGGTYTLFFDGTPLLGGTSGGFAIDALAVLSDNEFYISVDQYGGLNGTSITVYDEDIIRFTRSSPSANWVASLYFDGSAVGLTTSFFAGTTGSEGVDAIEVVNPTTILVSTKGKFSLSSGLAGEDEDIIKFTKNTSGGWVPSSALYFDGSLYGLGSEEPGVDEDVDGISVDNNGNLYLSTAGNFTVQSTAGPLTGTGADVFVFSGGSYSPTLYFTGSTLGGRTLSSIDLPPGFVAPTSAPPAGAALSAAAATGDSAPAGLAASRGDWAPFAGIAEALARTPWGPAPLATRPATDQAPAPAPSRAAAPETGDLDQAFTLLAAAARKRDASEALESAAAGPAWDPEAALAGNL